MNDITSFGEWLRRRRKALDLTQAELADQAGCVTGTIRSIEADTRRPSKQLAERLVEAFRRPVDLDAGGRVTVTLSVGYAAFGPHTTAEAVLRRVDEAMYGAKRTGRNRAARLPDQPA